MLSNLFDLAKQHKLLEQKCNQKKQKCNRSLRSRVRDVQPISCLRAHGFALSRANMSVITGAHVHAQWRKALISCPHTHSVIKNAYALSHHECQSDLGQFARLAPQRVISPHPVRVSVVFVRVTKVTSRRRPPPSWQPATLQTGKKSQAYGRVWGAT